MTKSIVGSQLMELWKDVKGYEGCYQVSNLGNIRSLDRRVVNHQGGTTRICKGGLMTPFDNGHGYLVIALCKDNKRKNHYMHRLVADAFVENPDEKNIINHLDYNTKNNNAGNLEWCTQVENVRYSVEHLRKPRSKCKPTLTGHKHIGFRYGRFRVHIDTKGVDRTFATIESAIAFRDKVLEGVV
jgi:hypothetical protein